MNIFDDIIKLVKINKFNAEIRTKDGTFLILDGELGTGINVMVQTSEGISPIPDGPYVLGTPYDGVIIEIVKGKIKQIIHPLKNEPMVNPLETPPNIADGAVGIVGGGVDLLNKQNKMEKFVENVQTTAKDGPADVNTNDGIQTTETDKATVYTIEQLSSMIDDVMGQLKTLSDKVSALEGGNDGGTQTNEQTQPTDTQNQKMSAEVKKQVEDYLSKHTPATPVSRMEADEIIENEIDPVLQRVKDIQRKNKK